MKPKTIYILLACAIFTDCIKWHKFSTDVCDGTLYVEIFNVNPTGVDVDYITDSVNFRMYAGNYDNEHENLNFTCSGDSLVIRKIADVDFSGVRRTIDSNVFSIKELKSVGEFEY